MVHIKIGPKISKNVAFHNFCATLPVSRRVVKLRLPIDLECVKFHYRLVLLGSNKLTDGKLSLPWSISV